MKEEDCKSVKHFSYLLRCADGTIYSGYTIDPKGRMKVHNSGRGAKYTRSRLPVSLVYCECFETKIEALKREAAYKKMTRAQKEELISENNGNDENERSSKLFKARNATQFDAKK